MARWLLAAVDSQGADWDHARQVQATVWPMRGLGVKQRQILLFLLDYQQRYGGAPTIREIAEEVAIASRGTINHHLRTLEAAGWIRRGGGLHAAVTVIAPVELIVAPQPLRMRA